MAVQPDRHASTKDPSTWSDYGTALAAVQAGYADGISYVLTEDDPFAAIDLDHCRDPSTHSIDVWAQNFLDVGRHAYHEVTPSGAGVPDLGTGKRRRLHRKFTLEIDGKEIAAELFRRTNKALTITGSSSIRSASSPISISVRLGRGVGRTSQSSCVGAGCANQRQGLRRRPRWLWL